MNKIIFDCKVVQIIKYFLKIKKNRYILRVKKKNTICSFSFLLNWGNLWVFLGIGELHCFNDNNNSHTTIIHMLMGNFQSVLLGCVVTR